MSVKNHIRSRFSIDFISKSLPKPTCESMANFEEKFRRSCHRSTKRCCENHGFTYVKPHFSSCQQKSKLDRATRKVDETNIENTIEKRPARSMSTQPFRHPFWYQKTMKNLTFCTQMGSFWVQIGRHGSFLPPSWPSRVDLGSIGPTRIDPGRSQGRSWVDGAPRGPPKMRAPRNNPRRPGSNSLLDIII